MENSLTQFSPEKLVIPTKAFEELLSFYSRKLVGKCLKRFEISDNKEIIKTEVKEILYEGFRDFSDALIALNYGISITVFDYKKSNKENK